MRRNIVGISIPIALALSLYAQTAAPPTVVPISKEEHHHLVLDNDYVRVYSVEVAPHSETLYHQHDLDYIFVTLGDSDVDSVRVGEQPAHLLLKDREVRFTKGGFAHKAVNNTDKPFRNVTIELKKQTGEVFCRHESNRICAAAGFGFDGSGGGYSDVLQSTHWLISKQDLSGSAEHKLKRVALIIFLDSGVLARNDGTTVSCNAGEIHWIVPGTAVKTLNKGKSNFVLLEYAERDMPRDVKQ